MSKPWTKETLKLPKNHAFKAQPDCRIFIADHGTVRFDFPQDWVVRPADEANAIALHDKQPPRDSCRIMVTPYRIPRELTWDDLPLEQMARDVLQEKRSDAELHRDDRNGLQIIWVEFDWPDPENGRAIRTRQMLARGGQVTAVITFDFYADEADKWLAVWEILLKSLQLDQYIADPTKHIAH